MNDHLAPVYARKPVAFTHGKGVYLYDTSGKQYIDFMSGIAVNALGHCHPKLIAALTEQAHKLWHTSNAFHIPNQEALARTLCHQMREPMRAFFTNSGAEAIEAGLKFIRKYFDEIGQSHKYRIICFEGAFHGRTFATIAAGGQEKYMKGFEPHLDGFDHARWHDMAHVKELIKPETAAILLEPIQGEGGVRAFSPEFLQAIKTLCEEHQLLLFIDEVQSGIGRTGTFFAHEMSGITPDVMATAKGLGGGFPVGACLISETIASTLTTGIHGSTFGGNPLAMQVAKTVIDIIREDAFLEQIKLRGAQLREGLNRLAAKVPEFIIGVRGTGLMQGIQLSEPPLNFVTKSLENGLITVAAGDNVVRLLPPLIITEAEINQALVILEETCLQMRDSHAKAS